VKLMEYVSFFCTEGVEMDEKASKYKQTGIFLFFLVARANFVNIVIQPGIIRNKSGS
jgi:hypothetical protein